MQFLAPPTSQAPPPHLSTVDEFEKELRKLNWNFQETLWKSKKTLHEGDMDIFGNNTLQRRCQIFVQIMVILVSEMQLTHGSY